MHNNHHGILFVEPPAQTSTEPLIDDLARIMAGALRKAEITPAPEGACHTCACGARGDNNHYILPGGMPTNSLAVHYLAWHRRELSPVQILRVGALKSAPVEPTDEELQAPPRT